MFPSVQVSVSGLDRKAHYSVMLELIEASDRRHKYVGGPADSASKSTSYPRGWTSAGPAEPQPSLERRRYLHPDGPALGSHWMQHPINFSKLKLTNNAVEHHSNVSIQNIISDIFITVPGAGGKFRWPYAVIIVFRVGVLYIPGKNIGLPETTRVENGA